jgi:Family of unknown function (DUF6326)
MKTQKNLEDLKINVKIKLASLWASFMFLYIYLDYFHLYMPDSLRDILAGQVFVFDVTPTFLLVVLAAATVPTLMIFLSIALPATPNRWANIVVATVHIPYVLFNLVGGAWVHMVFGAVVEVVLLCLIIRHAWQWPRTET